jgi:hypothetical protein
MLCPTTQFGKRAIPPPPQEEAHVRTGMEDNVRLAATTLAPSNAALVQQ